MLDLIDDLPEAIGISPIQKHGQTVNLRQQQINKKLEDLKECLKVIYVF